MTGVDSKNGFLKNLCCSNSRKRESKDYNISPVSSLEMPFQSHNIMPFSHIPSVRDGFKYTPELISDQYTLLLLNLTLWSNAQIFNFSNLCKSFQEIN